MTGKYKYWTTGIKLQQRVSDDGSEQWAASVEFFDAGDGNLDFGQVSTEGTLKTRFLSGPTGEIAAIRVAQGIKVDSERLGVEFRPIGPVGYVPLVYLHRDNWVSASSEVGTPELERTRRAVAASLGWSSARSAIRPADAGSVSASGEMATERRWRSWHEMTADEAGFQLGIAGSSVASAARREQSAFPQPVTTAKSGVGARWRAAEIFDYQLAPAVPLRRRPQPIPRLHPRRNADPMFSETVVARVSDPAGALHDRLFVVHLVDAQDGGEQIGIVYQVDPRGVSSPQLDIVAVQKALATQIPDDTALVLVRNKLCDAPDGVVPYITVLDQAGWWEATWSDLVQVLPGFQIPWWPAALRRLDAMRSWRPGLVMDVRPLIGQWADERLELSPGVYVAAK